MRRLLGEKVARHLALLLGASPHIHIRRARVAATCPAASPGRPATCAATARTPPANTLRSRNWRTLASPPPKGRSGSGLGRGKSGPICAAAAAGGVTDRETAAAAGRAVTPRGRR